MAGESGKVLRRISTGNPVDKSPSPGRQSATGSPVLAVHGHNASKSAENRSQQEDRTFSAQIFKRPKMESCPDEKEDSIFAEASESSTSWNVSNDHSREGLSKTPNDLAKVEETLHVSGECSTCGHTGFPAELFLCVKCSTRRQHTYCSNSYHPRKRWFLRLCNWCEAESTEFSSGGTSKQNQGPSKRDTWSGARPERSNAVDCLLGAALRLPTAGFSCVEDLLQVDSNASSSGKRRKPPSFDSVEKARRSGPSGDVHTVKSLKRSGTGSLAKSEGCPGSTGEVQKSPNSSVENGGRSPSIGSAPTCRARKSSGAGGDSAAATPTSSVTVSARDHKGQRSKIRNRAELGSLDACAGRASSCDSSEKHERTNGNVSAIPAMASAGEKASTRLSPNVSKGRVPSTKSPKSPAISTVERSVHEERTSAGLSSPENDVRMKRSSGAGPVEHVPRATRTGSISRSKLRETVAKNSKLSGTSRPRENGSGSDAPAHKRTRLENLDKHKRSTPGVLLEKASTDRVLCEGEDDIGSSKSCVELGFDSANIPGEQQRVQVQKSATYSKDSSASPKKSSHNCTNATGSKQHTQHHAATAARQKSRPSIAAGKSAGSSPSPRNSGNAEEKSHQKRTTAQKDSTAKVCRTSTKVPGIHSNYKSLSDILC